MDDMDHEHKRGSSMNLRVHFDVPPNEEDPTTHSQSSGSSSSLGSSLDLDAIEHVLNSLPLESKKDGLETQEPTPSADHSATTPLGSSQCGSATQSAPIQFMGRPADYDPNRIPSSIFSTRPTTPMDWSTASNESLFSLHIGNSSFSREHFIMLNKSGEFPRMDELIPIPATLPHVTVSGDDKSESANAGKDSGVTEASGQTSKVVWWEAPGDDDKEKVPPAEEVRNYNALSYRSDESNNSARSFNFPLLAGDGGLSSPVTLDLERKHPQQQSSPQNPRMISKRAWANWFCCFSFRSRCC